MARDPLATLERIRKKIVDEHRVRVSQCIRMEAEIESAIAAIDAEEARSAGASFDSPDRVSFLDMIYQRARQRRENKRALFAALAEAQGRTGAARAELGVAQVAMEAVGRLIDERAASARAAATRKEQHTLDDIARGMGRKTRNG